MAEKKPSGFRFRLPWLLQPAQSPAREPPTQPPRATTQTSAASTPAPAQRPPFRPPGKAPAPPTPAPAAAPPTPAPAAAPPTVATPIPFSTRRSPPQSATSPPPPSISPKSSVTKSPTDKTIEPVATQPTKETQATAETPVPTTPPQTPPFSPPRQAQSQPNPPQTPPPPSSVSSKKSVPKSPIAKTTKPVAPQPAKETQTITETIPTKETAGPATPPLSPTLSPHTKAQPQPSPPQITPLPSPSVSPKSPVPKSPIAKNTEPIAAQPDKETQTATNTTPTIETTGPATPFTQAQSQPSPPQTPPPAKQSQTRTPPRSPSPLTSEPADKTPSHPIKTTTEGSEIKRSTAITGEKLPVESNLIPQGNHLALDEKPREITEVRGTQTTSMDSNSPELKPQKPKLTTATRVPLHREIKDNISRLIHKTATSSMKQPMDEKPASVITIAGDNTGASMHLSSDEIKRGHNSHKLTTDTRANDSAINGDKSENKEATAIVNSNVQGINNSMMFNSSVSERNPGVHLGFYHNLANDSMMKKTELIEMQRAEVNITPPQKVVYEPTIGIPPEGAYMEPSEWEIDEDEPETSGTGYEVEVL